MEFPGDPDQTAHVHERYRTDFVGPLAKPCRCA
jgi:hypothetical protein